MKLSNSNTTPSGMGLRCKDGDMAVMVGDISGCEGSIGCIVQVRGPTIKLSGFVCWRIIAIDNRKLLIREYNGVIVSETVYGIQKIRHPDCFLLPNRPPKKRKNLESSTELQIKRTYHANF